MLALGPFLVTTLIALSLGRLPIAMWGYPLWSFAPLAALAVDRAGDRAAAAAPLRRRIPGDLSRVPLAYAIVESCEPLLRDRPKATQFPGRLLADTITRDGVQRLQPPLAYVGGGEFAANNLAVYSPDRPRVIVHADPRISPWIDRDELRRRGAVIVWEDGQIDAPALAQLRSEYPGLDVQAPLTLPRRTFVEQGSLRPVRVHFAIVPPRP